jgi:hypothetical protein
MRDEKATAELSLDQIFSDLDLSSDNEAMPARGTTITLWIPVEAKERYVRLQRRTGRRFSKKVRDLILAAITMAESKAS